MSDCKNSEIEFDKYSHYKILLLNSLYHCVNIFKKKYTLINENKENQENQENQENKENNDNPGLIINKIELETKKINIIPIIEKIESSITLIKELGYDINNINFVKFLCSDLYKLEAVDLDLYFMYNKINYFCDKLIN